MARVTRCRSHDVTRRFAPRGRAVVAGRTASGNHSGVAELSSEPARRFMARITRLRCR